LGVSTIKAVIFLPGLVLFEVSRESSQPTARLEEGNSSTNKNSNGKEYFNLKVFMTGSLSKIVVE